MRTRSKAGLLLVSFALSGCQCIDPETFGVIPDAGTEVIPPGPVPPKFPLKQGDVLVFPGVGGRNGTGTCAGLPGDCERTMRATYTVKSVSLGADSNRWTVKSDYLYEMAVANVDVEVIDPLFLSGTAKFTLDAQASEDGTADFNTDGAPVDDIVENDFPFFHYESAYAGQAGSAFDVASIAFRGRIADLDAEAEIEAPPAAAKFEAYFKDDRVQPAQLHKVRVDLSPFGFMCSWEERMIPWEDDMNRAESDFNGAEAGLTAVFSTPIRLYRDDVQYICSCTALSKQCKLASDQSQCLDPADPEAPAADCP
jgi:hypothetical protein